MLQSNKQIIRRKLGILNLAEELGNVWRACKLLGYFRDTFYRYQDVEDQGGVEALLDQNGRMPNRKNRVDEGTKAAVVSYATDFPAHGQVRCSNELRKAGTFVSARCRISVSASA